MARFRKKAAEIEAIQWFGQQEALDFLAAHQAPVAEERNMLILTTEDGPVQARIGDWVVRGPTGEFHVCHPDMFAATYDRCE